MILTKHFADMSDDRADKKDEMDSKGANGERGGGSPAANENGAEREQRDDVCRDFLKNICNRGSRCKFYHPADSKQRTEDMINFCIDFQVCMRFMKLVGSVFCSSKQPWKLSVTV